MRTTNLCRTNPSFIKSILNEPALPFETISKRKFGFPELIKEKIFIKIFPILVFPAAFAPISTIAFLYLKLGLPAKCSPSMIELTIFFGYEKFILKLGNPRIFSNSRFIITISSASLFYYFAIYEVIIHHILILFKKKRVCYIYSELSFGFPIYGQGCRMYTVSILSPRQLLLR